jgi:hypothetical protein
MASCVRLAEASGKPILAGEAAARLRSSSRKLDSNRERDTP